MEKGASKQVKSPFVPYYLAVSGARQGKSVEDLLGKREEILHPEEVEEEDADQVFKRFRLEANFQDQVKLGFRGLSFEKDLYDRVLERVKSSRHDVFIQNAFFFLGMSMEDPTKALQAAYEEMASPYAQAMACLLIGLRSHSQDDMVWLLSRASNLSTNYPGQDYKDGALLGIQALKKNLKASS